MYSSRRSSHKPSSGLPRNLHVTMTMMVTMMMLMMMAGGGWAIYMPICQINYNATSSPPSYCKCAEGATKSGPDITIICDFGEKEDVVLTDALYPFTRSDLILAKVQIKNATSVHVTRSFLRAVQSSPSVALDFWRCGTVYFDATPDDVRHKFSPSFSTFIGIGLLNCTVPSLPAKLMRDRVVAGLLIKRSRIDTIDKGVLYNIQKLRYITIENTTVGTVSGSLSNTGSITVEPSDEQVWHGLHLVNATIKTIKENSFTFANEVSGPSTKTCEVKIINSHLGVLEKGAITMMGKVDVTIHGNSFQRLLKDALKVNITGDLKFEENVVELLENGGLKSLLCNENTSMEKNTVYLNSPSEAPYNSSNIPFDASCGNPQVFIVMSPPQPRVMSRTSSATWVLLTLLLLFVGAVVFMGLFFWRNKTFLRQYRRGGVPIGLQERTTLQELRYSAELTSVEDGSSDTGVSNPVYDIREPS